MVIFVINYCDRTAAFRVSPGIALALRVCVCVCCIFGGLDSRWGVPGSSWHPPPLRNDFCILNYTIFYLFKISDISQCVPRVPLCDSSRLRARCAFCKSCFLDLEEHRHFLVCATCAFYESYRHGPRARCRPVLRKLFFRSRETATSLSAG